MPNWIKLFHEAMSLKINCKLTMIQFGFPMAHRLTFILSAGDHNAAGFLPQRETDTLAPCATNSSVETERIIKIRLVNTFGVFGSCFRLRKFCVAKSVPRHSSICSRYVSKLQNGFNGWKKRYPCGSILIYLWMLQYFLRAIVHYGIPLTYFNSVCEFLSGEYALLTARRLSSLRTVYFLAVLISKPNLGGLIQIHFPNKKKPIVPDIFLSPTFNALNYKTQTKVRWYERCA